MFPIRLILSFVLVTAASVADDYVISTIAGGAPPPTPIAAASASIGPPSGIVADPAGNVYFSSLNCVFKLDGSGILTRVAGNSRAGYSGDGGPATSAQLNNPAGLAIDSAGNLYIADYLNMRVRRVSPDGLIVTWTGSGAEGYSGDGGAATSAQLDYPAGLAVDSDGSLYIADLYNNRVRRVSKAGIITTVAGGGSGGVVEGGPATGAQLGIFTSYTCIAVDSASNLYIADTFYNRVLKVSKGGTITTIVDSASRTKLDSPIALAVDPAGDLFISDVGNNRVIKVFPSGIVATVAGNGASGYAGDGGTAVAAQLNGISSLAVGSDGSLILADFGNYRIRKVSLTSVITTIAGNGLESYSGDGGPAINAQLNIRLGNGLAVRGLGDVFFSDSRNLRVRRILPDGSVNTIAGNGTSGDFGDGGLAISAQFGSPLGLALDPTGNLYFADGFNRVRKISPLGILTTIAGTGTSINSVDNVPATTVSLNSPVGVALDSMGNLFIAEALRVRKVSPLGIITTVAGNGSFGYSGDGGPAASAQLSFPTGLAVDSAGNLYFADTGNHRVRRVSAAGIITTVAGNGTYGYSGDGGPATSAQLFSPLGLALDTAGNLYITDSRNERVRKVSPDGKIVTIAGNGAPGYSGDGGPASSAQLREPFSIALDSAGNVYVADSGNNALRLLKPNSTGERDDKRGHQHFRADRHR